MNTISSLFNWLGNLVGADPNTLTTTSKTLVGAINEVDAEFDNTVHITESGTSGIWTYRKWSDGTAECWGSAQSAVTAWTAWGGIYIAAPYDTQQDYPAGLFTETPNLQAQLNASQGDFFLVKYSTSNAAGSKDKTDAFYLARGTNGNVGSTYTIAYYAIGKWQ